MKRLIIAVPLFLAGYIISLSDFGLIWRYFGWANQALAVFVLWTAAIYLAENRKFHWIASVPAVFMTVVATTFIANSTIGFNLSIPLATAIGIGASVLATVLFFRKIKEVS
jgi:carbon starvation protein CstA